MKITSVSVSGCGRFGTEVRVQNFGPGVNILSARNEAGKSTLFRAIRTCLFERHSAGGKDIAALATEGLSLPVAITVGFEQDGHRYEIRKSFLKSKSASLTRNGTEVAKNAEADEQVWDLLGISPKSTRSLDEATYGLLWVQQGQSFDLAKPSEGAKSVLNDVITQEVGTLVGGERARLLLSTVREELSPLVTDTGRPKANGPYDAAIKRADSIREERLKLEEQLKDLDESLERLARLRADMKRVSDPAESQRMRRELDETQKQLKSALEAEKELKACEAAERQAHQLLTAQRDKCEALQQRAKSIDLNRSQIKALRDSLAPLVEEEAGLRRTLSDASAKKASLEKELDALDQEQRRLQRLSDLLAKSASRDRQPRCRRLPPCVTEGFRCALHRERSGPEGRDRDGRHREGVGLGGTRRGEPPCTDQCGLGADLGRDGA
jgi:DNA repair exonuclease SbcCD ATPase subunit